MISNMNLFVVLLVKLVVSTNEDNFIEPSSPNFNALNPSDLLEFSPAVKLNKPSNFTYTSLQDFKRTLKVSFFSLCPYEDFPFKCSCGKYKEIKIVRNNTEGTSSFIGVDPKTKTILASYRPAFLPINFLRIIDTKLVHYPNTPADVKVHRGFYQLMMSTTRQMEDAISNILKNREYRNYPIKIAGYSLGASITTVSVPEWMQFLSRNHYTNPIAFYSYAGPRVGNSGYVNFISNYNAPIMRYTHSDDNAVLYPPRKLGYVHAGVEFYGPRIQDGVRPEWRICSQEYDEDPTCGLRKVRPVGFVDHLFPNSTFSPSPYDCEG